MSDSLSTETDERLAAAVGQYALGELTMGQAAERAGLSRFEMRSTLRASSVDLRVGPEDRERAADELDVARAVR
jgi:predicted HTH domain antitoxin